MSTLPDLPEARLKATVLFTQQLGSYGYRSLRGVLAEAPPKSHLPISCATALEKSKSYTLPPYVIEVT
jgi:hypothetical protein